MKLLPKCKSRNSWLTPKFWKVMKLTSILIIALTLNVSAAVSSQTITFSGKNVSAKKVLSVIKEQTTYVFFYDVTILKNVKPISIDVKNASIEKVLQEAFKESSVKWIIQGKTISLIPKDEPTLKKSTIAPINRKIKGKVSNEKGESLPGVNILAKGTKVSTQTDVDGSFEIEIPDDVTVLVVTYIGLQDQEVKIVGDAQLNIVLKEVGQQMNEVIVVGYGSQNRRTVSTSVSKLDRKVLENVPYSNVTQALQGNVSGVVVRTASGQPGKASNILVRGGTSIDNPAGATPLYIVDGVIRSQIDDINSADIASLQVLKDAASTSIYGARGSNGVVIITTSTAKVGKTKITFGYSSQFSQIAKQYDFLGGEDFIRLSRLGVKNAADIMGGTRPNARDNQLLGATPYGTGNNLNNNTPFATLLKSSLSADTIASLQAKGWQEMADPLNAANTIMFKSTDWNDVLFQDAFTQNYNLNFSGGTDKGLFDLSLGYLKGDGVTIYTGYERFTAKMNASFNLADNFTLNGKMLYARSNNNQVVSNSVVFNRYLGNAPTTKFLLEDGTLAPGQNNINGNPLYQMGKVKGINENEKLQLAVDGDLKITKDLNFAPSMSLYTENTSGNTFQQAFLSGSTGLVDNTRTATQLNNRLFQTQFEGVFTYTKSFDEIGNFQAKLGASNYGRTIKTFNASGKGSPSDLAQTLDSSPIPVSVYANNTKLVMNGVFGRLNYDYKNKYLFTGSFRYDGASSLGPDNKYGFFPGVSVGWNVHEEEFWKAMPTVLSSFKLRGSFGINGNLGTLGDFQAGGLYSGSVNGIANNYNGQSAIVNSQIANPGLKWEQSQTNNIGFDLGINEDKIRLIGDFYNKLTSDLLTNLTLPSNSGFSTVLTNLGGLRSKGFEMELSANIYNQNDLKINAGFIISHNTNVIETLPYNGNLNNRIGGTQIWDAGSKSYVYVGGSQEGQKIGDFYAHKQLYILPTQAAADAYNATTKDTYVTKTNAAGGNPNGIKYPGDAVFEDTDGNNVIDSKDRTYMGNMFPKYVGGFNFDVSYKGFSLVVRTDYSLGATIYNEARARFVGQFQGNYGLLAESLQSWQKEGDITDVPRYRWADQTNQNNLFRSEASGAAYNTNMFQGNSRYYESGDYLCLREITLAYTVPSSFANKIKLASARFYLTGSNLYYFTKYTGLNPEVQGIDGGSSQGLNSAGATGTYPVPRNIILGLNVSL
ncbi:TonB-dependent receptor [Flavobacterium sp. 103]|uniref:TonB-dependent receptor n=1 Tax=Flavobacterium sp. 103 TaxID=2135624 RepID=UPI000E3209D1|nr:TonB-dependent receptor [Flavobacterium sp. 103]